MYYCNRPLPAVYDDSFSYYEDICILRKLISDVASSISDYQSQIDALEKRVGVNEVDISAIRKSLDALYIEVGDKYNELLGYITELFELIDKLGGSQLQWDCQLGLYTDTMNAQRDMFNDVTVHGITVDDLTKEVATVDDLANCGLNVRGLAVLGLWIIDKFDIPIYFKYVNNTSTANMSSNGYIYWKE